MVFVIVYGLLVCYELLLFSAGFNYGNKTVNHGILYMMIECDVRESSKTNVIFWSSISPNTNYKHMQW